MVPFVATGATDLNPDPAAMARIVACAPSVSVALD
jgi:hypothetical protein